MDNVLKDLLDGLAPKEAEAKDARRPSSLETFLEEDVVTDNGRWTIAGHEPFGEILSLLDRVLTKRETDTDITVLKAEQIGATTLGLGAALHLVADRARNVGYFLPTKGFAHNFGRTRIKRMIERSKYLATRMRDRGVVNQASLKEFDGRFLYVLGLESMLGAISVPLDVLIYDEVDLLPAENLEWSQGRVAHSDLRVSFYFSAGYSPGAGIDLRFQEGTQHKFFVTCSTRGCRTATNLEESFPDCMAKLAGKWERVCPKCFGKLDLVGKGRWVASYPERAKQRKYSYRVSALAIPAMPAEFIMKRWEKAKRRKSELAKFRCAVLAIPDAGAMQPITDAELRRMESKSARLKIEQGDAPRYAGMDTGDLCHFWCHEKGERRRIVWLEEIDSDVAVERVTQLIGALGIRQLVIDKKPLTTLARALAYRFPNVVLLQDFRESSEMEIVQESHVPTSSIVALNTHEAQRVERHDLSQHLYRCVKVNRDESLDDFTSEITDPTTGLLIPELESDAVMAIFAQHLKNLRKERMIDAKGRAIDKYIKAVPNHFGMAGNSARLAELVSLPVIPFRYEPPATRLRSHGIKGVFC
jgi:hypothetical protein